MKYKNDENNILKSCISKLLQRIKTYCIKCQAWTAAGSILKEDLEQVIKEMKGHKAPGPADLLKAGGETMINKPAPQSF